MLGSWSIACLHLSSHCFLLMRSAEGCIIGLASVRPNFLRLTFDHQAEGASLSLSSSCQVSPAAEETHQAAALRCVLFPPHLLHLSFKRWLQLSGPPLVVTSLWLGSHRATFGCCRGALSIGGGMRRAARGMCVSTLSSCCSEPL